MDVKQADVEAPPAGTALTRRAPVELPAELTVDDMVRQVNKIQDAMKAVMKKDVHYGVIPGTNKPSLLQPGAEKLCSMFRLAPDYVVTSDINPNAERPWQKTNKRTGEIYSSGVCKGFIRFTVICRLVHGPTGMAVASGVGTANNWEPKFISRDPYEAEETILQFARKRALVNATRTGTSASDIFTQDIEDMDIQDVAPTRTPKADAVVEEAKAFFGGETTAPEHAAEDAAPACPKCGGPMWDNRADRAQAQAEGKPKPPPAWKCKSGKYNKVTKRVDGCDGVIWEAHGEQAKPAPAAKPPARATGIGLSLEEHAAMLDFVDGAEQGIFNATWTSMDPPLRAVHSTNELNDVDLSRLALALGYQAKGGTG